MTDRSNGLDAGKQLAASAIGQTFVELLREELTPDEFAEMKRRNATPPYSTTSSCASHDFRDANEVMADAMAKHGIDARGRIDDDEVIALWNAAWNAATPQITDDPDEGYEADGGPVCAVCRSGNTYPGDTNVVFYDGDDWPHCAKCGRPTIEKGKE